MGRIRNFMSIVALSGLGFAGSDAWSQDFPSPQGPIVEQTSPAFPIGTANEQLGLPETTSGHFQTSETLASYLDEEAKGEETLEDRLAALEKAYQKDKDAADKKKADDAKKPTMKISGRIHFDYWAIPDGSPLANALETQNANPAAEPEDRFTFRRVRLTFQGDIPDNMLYRIDLEVANPNSPTIRDCFLGWKELPVLQTVLIGNQKRPYGLDHLNSSNQNIFLERPYIVEALNQDARRLGLASYGVNEDESWNWRFGTYIMDDVQNDDGTFGSSVAAGPPHGDHYQMEVTGRLANTFWWDEYSDGRGYGHVGVSGSYGDPDGLAGSKNTARYRTRPEGRTDSRWFDTGSLTGADEMQLAGFESVLNFGSLHFCGEYMQNWVQRTAGNELSFHGGYVQVAYFLTGEHQPWDRKTGTLARVKPHENFFRVRDCDGCVGTGWGAWQIAARYSHTDLSDEEIFGGVGDSVTAGLVWYWNTNARWQAGYTYGSIADRSGSGVPVGVIATSGDYHIFGCRFGVDF